MARHYDSFDKLKENVSETYASIAQLLEKFDWEFFSEDGAKKIEAYEILDDAFRFASDHNDLVKYVAGQVYEMANTVAKEEVVVYLVKYIRHNLAEEFWQDYSEFNLFKRGC